MSRRLLERSGEAPITEAEVVMAMRLHRVIDVVDVNGYGADLSFLLGDESVISYWADSAAWWVFPGPRWVCPLCNNSLPVIAASNALRPTCGAGHDRIEMDKA